MQSVPVYQQKLTECVAQTTILCWIGVATFVPRMQQLAHDTPLCTGVTIGGLQSVTVEHCDETRQTRER